jgi:16S rRNA (uracil1498-N3)-methyltransferase
VIRLYVTCDLSPGSPDLELSKEQAHYLFNVMRLRPGAKVAAFNGRDGEVMTSLLETGGRHGALALEERVRPYAPGPDVVLYVALVKRDPLERIVEKATELGVRSIALLTTRRTNAERTNVERLRRIAIEAAEQSGRLDAPDIAEPVSLEKALEGWDPGRRLMYCDEAGDDPAAEWGGERGRASPVLEALGAQDGGSWAILIGPEGGFDPTERTRLRGLAFVTPVTLGPRILRADTAAITALALWQAALGDWRRTKP